MASKTSKKSKPNRVQSAVYPNIWWDFTEVADELEKLRLEHAPNTKRNVRFPLAWILRAPRFTPDLYKMDGTDELEEDAGKRLITRAFEACGVMTDTGIAKLARYADSTTVCGWDVRSLTADSVQNRLFPALCDAYCIARRQHPNYLSATFGLDGDAFVKGEYTSKDTDTIKKMAYHIRHTRKCIESEAIWVVLGGGLDSHPGIASDTYALVRSIYRRSVALYATLMLSGDELGDLAHTAAALVAQHVAAFDNDVWGEHDNICLSSKDGKLDFTADRCHSIDGGWMPLHGLTSTDELASKGEDMTTAALRYASTQTLTYIERVAHAELERRSKIGGHYMPELHAEIEPTDEEEPSS